VINNDLLKKAVSSIRQRSERQQDLQKVLWTFVDVGILPLIQNNNHQIIYGRRGTGKTHIFRVLASNILDSPNTSVVYIDARTLGSTSQFSDPDVPLKQRCICLFKDILTEVHDYLLDDIATKLSDADANRALELLDELAKIITVPTLHVTEESRTIKNVDKSSSGTEIKLSASEKGGGLNYERKNSSGNDEEVTRGYKGVPDSRVVFPALHSHLNELLIHMNTTLFLLVDEWSSLPLDIQPYLAEFIKRGFIPNPYVVVKIASLEYRSSFNIPTKGAPIGFEIGSDISTAIDIDDYYVYDRNPTVVTQAFGDILFKHLKSELPDDYINQGLRITSGSDLVRIIFSSNNAFNELVRASEGVARDLINIFTSAYFDSLRNAKDKIEKRSIIEAARQWFEQDKSQNLGDDLRHVLERIATEVIGKKRARSFLIPRELERHRKIQALFDCRVLHLMRRGYADKDNPGVRYNIYSLDYGTYVDLIGTSKQPELDFGQVDDQVEEQETVVPFDDKRTIRRIILTRDVLEEPDQTFEPLHNG